MRVSIFQVDAFTKRLYGGNPAAVVVLPEFPDDAKLQAIAQENNLAETAFLVPDREEYRLRWFTPLVEVPLCGHATLASAAVVMERLEPQRQEVTFNTLSGPLTVVKKQDVYVMDFPARPSQPDPSGLNFREILGLGPIEVYVNAFNYLAILADEQAVRTLEPDLEAIRKLDRPGVIVSARGDSNFDFVSRYFAPQKGIPEDPVTGAAHCMLAPYWSLKLGKTSFRAFQASKRGGEMRCSIKGERVELEGNCVFYLEGEASI